MPQTATGNELEINMARVYREAIRHLYSVENAREIDRMAIEDRGIAGIVLMKRAGRAALEALQEKWPRARHIEVFCGAGNNAGDGYILAGLAADQGFQVVVWEMKEPDELRGDAALAREYAKQTAASLRPYKQYQPQSNSEVLVDALLGTGFQGSLKTHFREAIDEINGRRLPVLALDVPSGLDANTGWVAELAVYADLTISFIVMKMGLLTGLAPDHVGELLLDDLDIDPELTEALSAPFDLIGEADLLTIRQPRAKSAHKGDYGTLLVIGGDHGFGGAAIMAAETALMSGAGRVVLATRPEHLMAALSRCPEVMVHAVETPNELAPLLKTASALVVGPGLGTSNWSRQLLSLALEAALPSVLDADALNLLAQDKTIAHGLNSECLLTPHPGEAGRLLGVTASEVQRDRFLTMRNLQENYPGTIVLKGAGTLVATAGQVPGVCGLGNPGMATAGMGDVLSGLCGALLARGYAIDVAAKAAVLVHSAAADKRVARNGEVGLRATDLLEPIRSILNGESLRV